MKILRFSSFFRLWGDSSEANLPQISPSLPARQIPKPEKDEKKSIFETKMTVPEGKVVIPEAKMALPEAKVVVPDAKEQPPSDKVVQLKENKSDQVNGTEKNETENKSTQDEGAARGRKAKRQISFSDQIMSKVKKNATKMNGINLIQKNW